MRRYVLYHNATKLNKQYTNKHCQIKKTCKIFIRIEQLNASLHEVKITKYELVKIESIYKSEKECKGLVKIKKIWSNAFSFPSPTLLVCFTDDLFYININYGS